MWVLKLGGSLLGTPELARWLEIIVKYSDGKVVIVPGGGLFANSVREAQQISNVSDEVAHRLALLAMDQFGILLAGMNPGLVTADSELELAERGWQHRGIVWLPSKMALADRSIPQNWQLTSDSISAWLANKIGAEQLILVKSKSLINYQKEELTALQHLVNDEVIDSQFNIFSAEKHFQAWALNKADYTIFEHGFSVKNLLKKGLLINGTLK
jgi:aspartokinase-like uncharacterized kinase